MEIVPKHSPDENARDPVVCRCGHARPAGAHAVDAEAAQGLARQNNCFKCHAIDKEKVGPAWKDVAAKNKGNKDAEAKIIKHLTSGGSDGKHPVVKAKSPDDVKNLADWILSL